MYLLSIVLVCFTLSSVRSEFDFGLLATAKNPFQYLEELSYVYENHTVITEDGYKLLLVRIPYDRNETSSDTSRPPLLFVHGILSTLHDFLLTGPGISIGFKAVEDGYDVFFLNTRGSRWSRSHTSLDPDTDANRFWNFSWHEVGIYDYPATIDYITNLTDYSDISVVAHSQGTTAFLAMASTRSEYNEKIKIAVLLAPVSYLKYAEFSLIVLLKNSVDFVQELVEAIQLNEILPYTPAISQTGRLLCSANSVLLPLCKTFFYELVGPSTQINDSVISALLTNYPAGASAKQLIHFLQNANSGEFRLYDYEEEGNLVEYGQSIPPDYNLTAITSPVALYYSTNDYFVNILDAARLAANLPNVVKNVLVPYLQTNHFDVLMGKEAEDLVTEPALSVLNEYNNL